MLYHSTASSSTTSADIKSSSSSRLVLVTIVSIVVCMQLPPVKPSCPTPCQCRWKNGKQTTECADRGLTVLPADIDVGTQVLDMTGNNLQALPKEVFLKAGLLNLQKLHLSRCNIETVDKHAFSRLANLIELDLSQNRLAGVPTESFVNIPDLRRLVLNGNIISRIEAEAFAHLKSLISLEMANCIIETIDDQAFDGLSALKQLKLNGNRLRTILQTLLPAMKTLSEILLTDNPWKCDCEARDFHQWLLKSEVPYYVSPQCQAPPRLKGFDLDKLPSEDFACAPTGSVPYQLAQVQEGSNVTLECKVTADPEPFLYWMFQDTVITNGTDTNIDGSVEQVNGRTYWVDESEAGSHDKISALFLESVDEKDIGQYVCVAENRGGRYLANFTLEVTRQPTVNKQLVPLVVNRGFFMGLTIGIGVFATLLTVLVCLLLVKCCCQRWKREKPHKIPRSETQETKGSSIYDSPSDPLGDKCSMLQPTNPVQKPPRSFNNSTYVSTSPISLHDYTIQESNLPKKSSGGELMELTVEPQSRIFSIKPDIIKVDNLGEYSVPRSQHHTNGNASSLNKENHDNAIYQNTAWRWNNESPIATCNSCGDHTTSCLGVPCLHSLYSDTESDHSSYRANVRPTASGLPSDTSAVGYNDNEWPRPPPPLYDTIKPVWQQAIPPRIDERYELADYNGESSSEKPVWERQSPTTAAATAAVAMGAAAAAASYSQQSPPPNVHLKESVPELTPFPLLNLSTVRDSPDEGYEDEGDEGTEV